MTMKLAGWRPYAGVIVGLTISITANVMNASSGPEQQWWTPWLGGCWPLLLFLTLEIIAHEDWGTGKTRKIAIYGAGPVAVVAAVASYTHLCELLLSAGEHWWLAVLEPLAIDGLMTTSAASLLVQSRRRASGPTGGAGARPPARPSGAPHDANPQVSGGNHVDGQSRQPVSPETLDKVITVLRSGQPMTTGQIANQARMGRSTASRAIVQLLADERLMSVTGLDPQRPRDPYYSLAEATTREGQ